MSAVYLKRGESVRLNFCRGLRTLASTLERGAAGMREGRFFSASLAPDLPWTLPVEPVEAIEDGIRSMVPRGAQVERLEILLGTSHHVLGETEWSEAHSRVFLACFDARTRSRVEILRGGATPAELDLRGIAASLRSWHHPGDPRESEAVELGGPVTAALAAHFAATGSVPPEVPLIQEPHPSFPLDGNGERIERFDAAGSRRADWPNVDRPSYRVPPRPAILHARLESVADDSAPPELRAVEPLGGVRFRAGAVELETLMEGVGGSFRANLRIPLSSFANLGRADDAIRWFPVGAGAWGETLVARNVEVESAGNGLR
ncbi:MAG: hypothetical protein ABR524_02115 [Thermoanaerobaculia bacterium]